MARTITSHVRRQLDDIAVEVGHVHRERVAVILEPELDAACLQVLPRSLEIVPFEHEGDVAQAGRFLGARRRHDLGLEERDAPAELAHEDRPVVLARLVLLFEPENIPVPRNRRRAVADIQRDVVEPVEPEGRHKRTGVFSSKGTSGQAPLLQFEMTVAVTPATGSCNERNDTPAS